MTVVVTRHAARDLGEAHDFIARDNPRAARRVLDHLLDVFQRLDNGELNGREVRLLDGRRAHRWPVPPYVVYYRRSAHRTVIVRVHHQARRPIE